MLRNVKPADSFNPKLSKRCYAVSTATSHTRCSRPGHRAHLGRPSGATRVFTPYFTHYHGGGARSTCRAGSGYHGPQRRTCQCLRGRAPRSAFNGVLRAQSLHMLGPRLSIDMQDRIHAAKSVTHAHVSTEVVVTPALQRAPKWGPVSPKQTRLQCLAGYLAALCDT